MLRKHHGQHALPVSAWPVNRLLTVFYSSVGVQCIDAPCCAQWCSRVCWCMLAPGAQHSSVQRGPGKLTVGVIGGALDLCYPCGSHGQTNPTSPGTACSKMLPDWRLASLPTNPHLLNTLHHLKYYCWFSSGLFAFWLDLPARLQTASAENALA
jgi:hypothetical protein